MPLGNENGKFNYKDPLFWKNKIRNIFQMRVDKNENDQEKNDSEDEEKSQKL